VQPNETLPCDVLHDQQPIRTFSTSIACSHRRVIRHFSKLSKEFVGATQFN